MLAAPWGDRPFRVINLDINNQNALSYQLGGCKVIENEMKANPKSIKDLDLKPDTTYVNSNEKLNSNSNKTEESIDFKSGEQRHLSPVKGNNQISRLKLNYEGGSMYVMIVKRLILQVSKMQSSTKRG